MHILFKFNRQNTEGAQEIEDAIADHKDAEVDVDEEEQLRNQHEGQDFDYHDDDDQNENQIPKDLDGWCWACSESESDLEEGDDKTCKASKDEVQTANHHHDGGTSGSSV